MHIYWRRKWQPTPVLLPRKFHGWRSLVGYSPWGRKESDTTEELYFTSLHAHIQASLLAQQLRTCLQLRQHMRHALNPWIVKIPSGGDGNPLQYSCLENPKDRGAWGATVHRVTRVRHNWSDWALMHIQTHTHVHTHTHTHTLNGGKNSPSS